MENKFEKVWNTLVDEYDYDRGDIVDYNDILEACSKNFLPHLNMQEVSDFEKEYGLIINW